MSREVLWFGFVPSREGAGRMVGRWAPLGDGGSEDRER